MGTEKLDTYLDMLGERDREIVTNQIWPLSFARGHREEERRIQRMREELATPPDHPRTIAEVQLAVAREEAMWDERASATCIMPEIQLVRNLHPAHPVFAIPWTAHDERCDACEVYTEDGFDTRMEEAERIVAGFSEEEQDSLIMWAERLLQSRESWGREGRPPVFFWLAHDSCATAESILPENLLMILQHPYFCGDLFMHTSRCERLRKDWLEMELALLQPLRSQERTLYSACAIRIGYRTGYVFAPAR